MEKIVTLVDKGQKLKGFTVRIGDSVGLLNRTTPEWIADYLNGILVDLNSLKPGSFVRLFSFNINGMTDTGYVVESVEIAGQARNDGDSK